MNRGVAFSYRLDEVHGMMRLPIIFLLAMSLGLHAGAMDSLPLFQLKGGKVVKFALKKETRYVALYYSASWCPPCRKTTPPLVQEYQRMLDQKEMPIEIVLVGSDESVEKMNAYMEKYGMIWPAVAWDARGNVNKYASEGIPHLALVECASGRVISHGTGPAGVEAVVGRMREITGVDTAAPFLTGTWVSKYGVLIAVGVSLLAIFLIQKWKAAGR